MIITCGQCQAKFKVAPEQIKETGSKVRCSNCQYVFTVYRPKRPAETALPPVDDFAGSGGPDDYYPAPGGGADRSGGSRPEDYYGDRTDEPARTGLADSEYDEDDYLDDDQPADDSTSMKERRDRRRQLYSDLEGAADDSDDYGDDPLDEAYDNEREIDDDQSGLPTLRRNRARVSSLTAEPEGEDYSAYDEDDFEETQEEFDPEDVRDTPAPVGGDLGLGADPVDHGPAETANKVDPFARLAAGYHAGEGKGLKSAAKNKFKVLAGLAVVAALLAVGAYFLTSRPKEAALVTGDEPVAQDPADPTVPGQPTTTPDVARASDDPHGLAKIVFVNEQQAYFYFKNDHVGNILILTGKVRNNYTEPRSFIRLRGHLLASDERILADRFAYAGNFLSEADLTKLPIAEIYTRLQFKGGENNSNVNVPPGGEVPFMLVFDNLPDGMAEYRIDPVGSDPAQ